MGEREASVTTIGNERAGFSVQVEYGAARVEGWGFWDREVATQFASVVLAAFREQPPQGILTLAFERLNPLRDEGQDSFESIMQALPELALSGVEIETGSQLTRLQLVRLVRKHSQQGFVRFT